MGGKRIAGPKGEALITFPEPWIFVGRIEGRYTVDMVGPYIEHMATVLGGGDAVYFHDWEKMDGYDSKCRKDMTDWVMKHQEAITHNHVMVRSKLVAMGVSTANLLLGGSRITSHTARSSFERALAVSCVKRGAGR
jgi:hypothetical protein